jgi:hypothetical protein
MFSALLVLTSTLSGEISQSLGKQLALWRRENVYELAFLELFWGLVFVAVTLAFGAEFKLDLVHAWPTMLARLILEMIMIYSIAEATIQADRSTIGFMRLITIPFMLVVDVALGYKISTLQFAGIGLMFIALVAAFHRTKTSSRGAGLAALSGFVGVGTVSLYKYDITHYNSVAAEQIVVLSCAVVITYVVAALHARRSPWRLLYHPTTGTQALANGIAVALESFAYSLAPASLVMTYKRSFALLWSFVFGSVRFHEHSWRRKLTAAALMLVSVVLLTQS